jgi:hypothetical protein
MLMELMPHVIAVVEDALRAMNTDAVDHLTRLRAVERYFELLELAEGSSRETRRQRWRKPEP